MNRYVIRKLKTKLSKYSIIRRIKYFGTIYQCSICNARLKKYLPLPQFYERNALKHGYQYFGKNEHINIDQYSCPVCRSSDRDRLYASYFKKIIKNKDPQKNLLHIAPAWGLNNLFLAKNFKVVTIDLFMEGVDFKMNIENMNQFKDNSFDYFICSHVLEHVENPIKALDELFRVLKPKGKGIIMAPVIPELEHTVEDVTHTTKEDRIRHYGQEDHLRLFSKNDFIRTIESSKFNLDQLGIKYFGEEMFKILGLKESSILYIGNKN